MRNKFAWVGRVVRACLWALAMLAVGSCLSDTVGTVPGATSALTTSSIVVVQDTMTDSYSAVSSDSSYDDYSWSIVDPWARMLVRVPTSEMATALGEGTLVSATLALSGATCGDEDAATAGVQPATFELRRLLRDWTTSNATDDCPSEATPGDGTKLCLTGEWGGTASPEAAMDATVTATDTCSELSGAIELDVTADVAAMLAGGDNHGWLLRSLGTSYNLVDTAEAGATGPRLKLSFLPPESECGDGVDNDADGLTDCADPHCVGATVCLPEDCHNGVDDDIDGALDCFDSECSTPTEVLIAEDVWLNGQSDEDADSNFEGEAPAYIDKNGRMLLRVPTADIAASVGTGRLARAYLVLTAEDCLDPTMALRARRVLVPWETTSVTWWCPDEANLGDEVAECVGDPWGDSPDDGAAAIPSGESACSELEGGIRIDITSDVVDMLAGGDEHGWLIDSSIVEGVAALLTSDSEDPEVHPRLLLELIPAETSCADGVDDDCNGATDCADLACTGGASCTTETSCTDGVDNDANGATDCSDLVCAGTVDCTTETSCTDGVDNDDDGLVDCWDSECVNTPSCVEICGNGLDDDADFNADCFDSDCADLPSCVEDCTNALDDDADGLLDCLDPECAGDAACPTESCGNLADDDGDGLIDCGDPDCASSGSCVVVPPDPLASAPPLSPTGIATFADQTSFLHEGASPVQTGVLAGTIDARLAAAVFGFVRDVAGAPLGGVGVTVLDHPEYGSTRTRANGRYDLALEGGGPITVEFTLPGHPVAQRTVETHWGHWEWVPDLTLVPYDPVVTEVLLSGATEVQVARGSTSSDRVGERTATLLFAPGTTATMVMADGSTSPLGTLHVRATEYTVGDDGPNRMPGALPPTSAYTYAVEFSVDEAVAAGATEVRFDHPVSVYLENYFDFSTGTVIPAGYYDRQQAQWVPQESGIALTLVSESAGLAQIDIDGDGVADAPTWFTPAEQARLADLYDPGELLWRVPVSHFTPWDFNLGTGPPEGAVFPEGEPEVAEHEDEDCPKGGSIISCMNRSLGESLPLVGTGLSLTYDSSQARGYARDRSLRIPFRGLPSPLIDVRVDIVVAGRDFHFEFDREAAIEEPWLDWTWDGLDAAGREASGTHWARVTVSYGYWEAPTNARRFAAYGRSRITTGSRRQSPMRLRKVYLRTPFPPIALGGVRRLEDGAGVGGWGLDVLHAYDSRTDILYYGNGTRRGHAGTRTVERILGECGRPSSITGNGDGGPAREGGVGLQPKLAAGPDGVVWIADRARIRRIDADGIVDTWADLRALFGYSTTIHDIDVEVATGAVLVVARVSVGGTWSHYLYRFTSPTEYSLLAGGPAATTTPASELDLEASTIDLTGATLVASDRHGNIYLAGDRSRSSLGSTSPPFGVHVIRPDERWEVIAGPPTPWMGSCAAPEPVRAGDDGACDTLDLAVAPDGSLFFTENINHNFGPGNWTVLRQVRSDGAIETVAGSRDSLSPRISFENGGSPVGLMLGGHGVAVGGDSSPVFGHKGPVPAPAAGRNFIHGLLNGSLEHVAGRFQASGADEGGTEAVTLYQSTDLDFAPDGYLYVGESGCIRRISGRGQSPLRNQWGRSGPALDEAHVASEDGSRIFVFDLEGRHLATRDAITGRDLLTFTYDAEGRIERVTDPLTGRATVFGRLMPGSPLDPAVTVTSPDGHVTTVYFDLRGYIRRVVDPASHEWGMTYVGASELLRTFTDPVGRTSTFEYDGGGQLEQDTGPRTTTLEETSADGRVEITATSPLTSTVDAVTSYVNERPAARNVSTRLRQRANEFYEGFAARRAGVGGG